MVENRFQPSYQRAMERSPLNPANTFLLKAEEYRNHMHEFAAQGNARMAKMWAYMASDMYKAYLLESSIMDGYFPKI